MKDRKLGIIGGMGPLATNIFFRNIIDSTKAESDQEHIWTVISSHSTMPDRTKVIEENLDKDTIVNATRKDIEILEKAEVEKIAIPCNTFHYFYDEVQSLTKIPIINMIDETMKKFSEELGYKAVILSTTGTRDAKVYEKYASKYGVEIIKIANEYYDRTYNIIYDIKATNKVERPEFIQLLNEVNMNYNPDGIVIACTELSLIPLDDYKGNNIIDAMDVLVKESILQLGYELK